MTQFLPSQQILFPPHRGKLPDDLPKPLIALLGPLHGIAIGHSWHTEMIAALRRNGYQGKLYIPVRIDADIGEYTDRLNAQEDQNNLFAIKRSTKIIYWQPGAGDVDLTQYTLALSEQQKRRGDVYFGSPDHCTLGRALAVISEEIPVYHNMHDLCASLMKIV